MRKWMLVTFILIIFPCLTVKATNVTLEIDETIGIILDFTNDFLYISGDALTPMGLNEGTIQLGDAPIYDLLTGLPVHAEKIELGAEVRIAYFYVPEEIPQAVTIWLYPNHEEAAVFTTTVSDNIHYTPDYCVFLSADGRFRITLTHDTTIYDPTQGFLTPEEIEPGQMFFIWVDILTASSPAQVYPEKVVRICQLQ
ncbi:MAG: hypothetical protein FWE11_08930 [Defluviitaleaceae bacterium]|nr:hypothetical protein [Defluviitaleaceae bacterium]